MYYYIQIIKFISSINNKTHKSMEKFKKNVILSQAIIREAKRGYVIN